MPAVFLKLASSRRRREKDKRKKKGEGRRELRRNGVKEKRPFASTPYGRTSYEDREVVNAVNCDQSPHLIPFPFIGGPVIGSSRTYEGPFPLPNSLFRNSGSFSPLPVVPVAPHDRNDAPPGSA